MDPLVTAANENHFQGERFNTYSSRSTKAGPNNLKQVPDAPPGLNLHYDINQIISPAQRASIQHTGIMAFHCVSDTGNDSSHNGGPNKRLDVAEMMEAQCSAGPGQANTPCFCYHLGDVIYPGSDEALYEAEFYEPYKGYGNAIVVIPGNHDYYKPDGLRAYATNFMQPTLSVTPGERPAMNLPWYYWVLDTPVATIIGLGAVDNYISPGQQDWFNQEMKNADPGKALIVAVHYPPYCFDGSNNNNIRTCIEDAFAFSGKVPDLLLSGHSHNFQHIDVPQHGNMPGYPVVVNGAGGVGVGGIRPGSGGNGGTLVYGNDTEYGAMTIMVDNNTKTITAAYYCAVSQTDVVATHLRHTFSIGYTRS
ncbi:MAG: metallophosphoesterase [Bacteroidia bacterium]|nr:metallophosphoesterase [Bacteroidia bacterium]